MPKLINITGTNGKTTTAKIIESVLTSIGKRVGLASSIGIYLNGERIGTGDCTGPTSFERLQEVSTNLDVIICENVLRHIREKNFYPQKADVCLITNVSSDHIHQTESGTVAEIAEIKSELITQNAPDGITLLNGDDACTEKIIEKQKPQNLGFYMWKRSPGLHKYNPQVIYYIEDNALVREQDGDKQMLITDMQSLPLTLEMKLEFNVYNVLAAAATLDSLYDLKPDELENALLKIGLDYQSIPGRFNVIDFKDFLVILDNAKNPESYREAFKTARSLKPKRLVSVIKASSTRDDAFIRELGEIAAEYSDFIYVKESFSKESEKKKALGGTIAKLLIEGITKNGFDLSHTKVVLDESDAVTDAIENAKKGDLVLIFGYRVDTLHQMIAKIKP